MNKTTSELENILISNNKEQVNDYLNKQSNELINKSFGDYFKDLLHEKKISQSLLFIRADISEKYGYKLLSGEKHTNQRDVLLRLCYAGELSFQETQTALRLYGMSPLYARIKRDALLISAFSNKRQTILDLNQYLKDNGESPLKNCGSLN